MRRSCSARFLPHPFPPVTRQPSCFAPLDRLARPALHPSKKISSSRVALADPSGFQKTKTRLESASAAIFTRILKAVHTPDPVATRRVSAIPLQAPLSVAPSLPCIQYRHLMAKGPGELRKNNGRLNKLSYTLTIPTRCCEESPNLKFDPLVD